MAREWRVSSSHSRQARSRAIRSDHQRRGRERVLYLEFGVFEGESMMYWASRLKNPKANLHGFDSLEGLPETWNLDMRKGYFSTNGALPKIAIGESNSSTVGSNKRYRATVAPSHQKLVADMDADLYSSTAYVLTQLRQLVVPGTYIYFDEFADRFNELRAFAEFVENTGMKFEMLGANSKLSKVVFQRAA